METEETYATNARIDKLEDTMNQQFNRIDQRFEEMDSKIAHVQGGLREEIRASESRIISTITKQIDDFVGLYKTQEVELAATNHRIGRAEKQIARNSATIAKIK